MKLLLFIHVLAVILLNSCNFLSPKNEVKAFIPGMYVSQWTSEFAWSRDTLQINPLAGSEGVYAITRRTYHEYNQENKPLPPHYKIEKWTGSFSSDEQVIHVHKNGRMLSFDPGKKEMKMGITVYKKL